MAKCSKMVATGELYAWGWNDCGQVGDGTMHDRPSPVLIPGLDIVSAFCGGKHSMVLTRMPLMSHFMTA